MILLFILLHLSSHSLLNTFSVMHQNPKANSLLKKITVEAINLILILNLCFRFFWVRKSNVNRRQEHVAPSAGRSVKLPQLVNVCFQTECNRKNSLHFSVRVDL